MVQESYSQLIGEADPISSVALYLQFVVPFIINKASHNLNKANKNSSEHELDSTNTDEKPKSV